MPVIITFIIQYVWLLPMKKWLLLLLIVACAPIDVSDAPQFKTVPYGDMPEQVMDIYKQGTD